MIRRNGEGKLASRKMFDGDGEAQFYSVLNGAEEMYGKGRLFSIVTLEKGCEVGYHVHHGDGETYFILSGEGEYNDNGTLTVLHPGDTSFTDDGEGHSLKCISDEPLKVVALILYTNIQ